MTIFRRLFDKIKAYLLNPHVLVLPVPGRPPLLHLAIHNFSMVFVVGQHDETGRKVQAIYYLRKKLIEYEPRYSYLKKTYCALVCATQRLRHICFTIPRY